MKSPTAKSKKHPDSLRSRQWFDNALRPDMTALYLERYLNYGLTRDELQGKRPIIGIAQTGSDLSPCNRPHLALAARLRDGIRDAGGIAIEFPVHPIQETGKRPTASLDRNLAYLSLVEILYGYPLDGVILTTGCDKTTPALLMAAATVDLPAICLNCGPMLNGWDGNKLSGSGTVIWKAREELSAGQIDYAQFMEKAASSAPSAGHCNTMGTASTMNALVETLGMALPGSAAIPAPYRQRGQMAYETGLRSVAMVWEDLVPSSLMTRNSFINAIKVNSAIGGSSNAPIHLMAIARHLGVDLSLDDWETYGLDVPLIVNLQPAGAYLGEDFYRAGGVPAVIGELIAHKMIDETAQTINGKSIGENYRNRPITNTEVIYRLDKPLKKKAGFKVMRGNLFDQAIMKLSVLSEEFIANYLQNPDDEGAFEGIAHVFDGPEDYHQRIDNEDEGIDQRSILFMRGTGPIGYPGAAEVVNMRAPKSLLAQGITQLPCVGDGRQSGTSASPSVLNAAPEAAVGSGLALLKTGDRVRFDVKNGTINALVPAQEWQTRQDALAAEGGYHVPESQTPWQAIQRSIVAQLSEGMVLKPALAFKKIVKTKGIPRDNH